MTGTFPGFGQQVGDQVGGVNDNSGQKQQQSVRNADCEATST